MTIFKSAVMCQLLVICASCVGEPQIIEGSVSEGIILHVSASPLLNRYQNEPHTLLLVCYQLSSQDAYLRLLSTSDGVEKLLAAGAFDPSVVDHVSMVIQPGAEGDMKMDLLSGAKYLGVIAGYFQRTRPDLYAKLYKITLYSDPTPIWEAKHSPHILIDLMLEAEGIAEPGFTKSNNSLTGKDQRLGLNH